MKDDRYCIVCDSQRKDGTFLVLVDRSKTRLTWWTTNDPLIVLRYRDLSSAQYAVRRLRHNKARVVRETVAESILDLQTRSIDYHEANAGSELGWDGHKQLLG